MPIASITGSALVWGLIWYPYRVLQEAGLSGVQSTLYTYLLATLCGVFLLPRVWRERSMLDGWALLLVLSAGWANLGYVLGMLYGEVMRVLLLFYLAPLWTMLLARWLLGEQLNNYGYLVILLSVSGMAVMLWEPQFGLPLPANIAEWFGLSAGLGFALANVVSRRTTYLGTATKSYGVWFGTVMLALPLTWWQGGQMLPLLDRQGWQMLILVGVVLCAASFMVQYAIAHLSATRVTVLFMSELVIAAVSSYFLAGEAMQWRDWMGALLIVSASLLSGRMHVEPGKNGRSSG